MLAYFREKLQLTERNLGQVFKSKSGSMHAMQLCCYEAKLPSLTLKTRPEQLLGSLRLDIILPAYLSYSHKMFIQFGSKWIRKRSLWFN